MDLVGWLNAVPQLVYTIVEYAITGGLALMAVYVFWPRRKQPDQQPDQEPDGDSTSP